MEAADELDQKIQTLKNDKFIQSDFNNYLIKVMDIGDKKRQKGSEWKEKQYSKFSIDSNQHRKGQEDLQVNGTRGEHDNDDI